MRDNFNGVPALSIDIVTLKDGLIFFNAAIFVLKLKWLLGHDLTMAQKHKNIPDLFTFSDLLEASRDAEKVLSMVTSEILQFCKYIGTLKVNNELQPRPK